MQVRIVDDLLWIASDGGQALILGIRLARGLYRTFPVFFSFILWNLSSDLLLFWVLTSNRGYLYQHYAATYYSFGVITYLLELGVLLEIAANVLRPATEVFRLRMLYLFMLVMLIVGFGSFFFAKWVNPAPFHGLRYFLLTDTTAAFMCLITFILIASFSQVLGLSWKNHVLQLATGLAFYSVMELLMEIMQSQLRAGPSYDRNYQFWSHFRVFGYVGTVFFWCYAFLKQEAPRKEFSPQMQKILVSLSGSAKRQTAVLARSREP
jgi:hypothetical protein